MEGEPADSGDRRNQNRTACAAVAPVRGTLDWDDAARISCHVLFWNGRDLERKLVEFQAYYNAARPHAALDGRTPLTFTDHRAVLPANLSRVRWVSYCRDLVQLPVAA